MHQSAAGQQQHVDHVRQRQGGLGPHPAGQRQGQPRSAPGQQHPHRGENSSAQSTRPPAQRQGQAARSPELAEHDRRVASALPVSRPDATQRGTGQPLQHAVPPLEAGADRHRGERRRPDRQSQHRWSQTAEITERAADDPPSTSSPTGITRASSSCSPLRTSSTASVRAWRRRPGRTGGAAPGAGRRSSSSTAAPLIGPPRACARGRRPPGCGPGVSSRDRAGHGHPTGVDDVRPGRPAPAPRPWRAWSARWLTPGGAQLLEQPPGGPAGVRIHAGGRLVEEHQLGTTDQGAGQVDRLLLPTRQPPVRRRANALDAAPLGSGRRRRGGWRTGRRGSAAARRP